MKTITQSPAIDALLRQMQTAELDDLAADLKAHGGEAWALRRAAPLAAATAVGTLQRRNRMPTTMRRFIERCALGALSHAQGEVADLLRVLGEGHDRPSFHKRTTV